MKTLFSRIRNRTRQARDMNVITLVYLSIIVVVLMSLILGKKFFSTSNFVSMAYQLPEFGFMALGMAVCTLTGGMDLSIVAISTLSSVLSSYTLIGIADATGNEAMAILLAVLVAIVVSTLCGLVNGLLIAKASVLPILATLSTMIFYNGIAMAVTTGSSVFGFPEMFIDMGITKVFGIPLVFIIFIVATVILAIVLERTAFGKTIYLYGEHKTVSLFSGIPNKVVTIRAFTLSGFLCGIAGLIMMSRVNSAKVGYGDTYLLQAILVCVLGGLNPSGGRGKLLGVFLAALILQVLGNAFTLLRFPSYINKFIWGLVLVAVMIIGFFVDKNSRKLKMRKEEARDAGQA